MAEWQKCLRCYRAKRERKPKNSRIPRCKEKVDSLERVMT